MFRSWSQLKSDGQPADAERIKQLVYAAIGEGVGSLARSKAMAQLPMNPLGIERTILAVDVPRVTGGENVNCAKWNRLSGSVKHSEASS